MYDLNIQLQSEMQNAKVNLCICSYWYKNGQGKKNGSEFRFPATRARWETSKGCSNLCTSSPWLLLIPVDAQLSRKDRVEEIVVPSTW